MMNPNASNHEINSSEEISTSRDLQSPKGESEAPTPGWKAGKAEWMIVVVLAIVSLMVALDATILVTALPVIAKSLNGNATDTFWTGTSYLLTQSVFQPFIVALSDVFGRRPFYLVSLSLFTVGTLICCLSNNFTQLLSGRSIQGIGGGGVMSLGLVILTDIIPLRQRPIYIGINQISWAIGTISGPLIGGLFVQHTTWRWIFYINFPFCGIGLLTVPLVMRLSVKSAPLKERLFYVDWIGAALFIASTCSFLIGMTWGGSEYPWKSWRTLVPIIVGFAGIVGTLFWERCGASRPFLRLQLFNSYSAMTSYIGAALQGLLMFCELYYIPFYLETVKDFTPTITGLALMPLTGALLPISIIVGRLMTKYGRYRWAIWSGWALTIIASGLLILLSVNIKSYGWVMIFVTVGFGHGLILMSLNFAIQAMAETQHVAYAAAMYTFARTFGMCIGVAVGGAVFQNQLSRHLADLSLPTAISSNAEGFVSTLKALPKSSQEYQSLILAYDEAFKNLFEVLTAIAGFAGLLSLLVKHYDMDKNLDSQHRLDVSKKQVSSPAVESVQINPTNETLPCVGDGEKGAFSPQTLPLVKIANEIVIE